MHDSTWVPGALVAVCLLPLLAFLNNPARRAALFGLALFGLILLPSLIVADNLILESRLYTPLLGLVLLVTAAADQLATSLRARASWWPAGRALGMAVFGVVMLVLVIQGTHMANSYRDLAAFTENAVAGAPHSSLAHLNRAEVYIQAGDFAKGREHLERALALDPKAPVVHNNLGVLFLRQGDLAQAEANFKAEIAINPTYDRAYANLGIVYRNVGQKDAALAAFAKALEQNPNNIDALGAMLSHHAELGQFDLAEQIQRRMEALGVKFFEPK
jgi:tetratricopeptide (TPR) repeat protein